MKILVDEMWSQELAERLRRHGYEALSVHGVPDLEGKEDGVVFAAAAAEGRVVLTDNAGDWIPLLRKTLDAGLSCPGLILTSNRTFPRGNTRTLDLVIEAIVQH